MSENYYRSDLYIENFEHKRFKDVLKELVEKHNALVKKVEGIQEVNELWDGS